jgi:hypothetical protein
MVVGLAAIAIVTPEAWAVYHPTAARFLQRDPVGYVDGMSLYEYVRSSPVGWRDAMGLEEITWHDPYETGNIANQLVLCYTSITG